MTGCGGTPGGGAAGGGAAGCVWQACIRDLRKRRGLRKREICRGRFFDRFRSKIVAQVNFPTDSATAICTGRFSDRFFPDKRRWPTTNERLRVTSQLGKQLLDFDRFVSTSHQKLSTVPTSSYVAAPNRGANPRDPKPLKGLERTSQEGGCPGSLLLKRHIAQKARRISRAQFRRNEDCSITAPSGPRTGHLTNLKGRPRPAAGTRPAAPGPGCWARPASARPSL